MSSRQQRARWCAQQVSVVLCARVSARRGGGVAAYCIRGHLLFASWPSCSFVLLASGILSALSAALRESVLRKKVSDACWVWSRLVTYTRISHAHDRFHWCAVPPYSVHSLCCRSSWTLSTCSRGCWASRSAWRCSSAHWCCSHRCGVAWWALFAVVQLRVEHEMWMYRQPSTLGIPFLPVVSGVREELLVHCAVR